MGFVIMGIRRSKRKITPPAEFYPLPKDYETREEFEI